MHDERRQGMRIGEDTKAGEVMAGVVNWWRLRRTVVESGDERETTTTELSCAVQQIVSDVRRESESTEI